MLSNLLYIFNVSCLVLDGVNEAERNDKDTTSMYHTRGSKVNLNTTPLTAEDIWIGLVQSTPGNNSYLQSIFGKNAIF